MYFSFDQTGMLQPLDLNLDEETLMKIVPFWRSSLGDSSAPRQQYYFDHFEIHPIKVLRSNLLHFRIYALIPLSYFSSPYFHYLISMMYVCGMCVSAISKIVASFLPGDLNYRYSSTQETLRSLLHSVIKVPEDFPMFYELVWVWQCCLNHHRTSLLFVLDTCNKEKAC